MQGSAQSKPRDRFFRLVCKEKQTKSVEALLQAEGFESERLAFYPLARRLTKEPFALGSSLAAYFGYLYIQDKSSMLPPLALNPTPGDIVLDMCASPGSKTGLLSQLVGAQGLVIANEPNPNRLQTLRQNLRQMNLCNVVTCRYKGQELPLNPGSIQHILLDVPCSGWGTVDKHPKVMDIWRQDRLGPLLSLQRELLKQAARLLAPGGKLLYSTCTTNEQENEEQIKWACSELRLELLELSEVADFAFTRPTKLEGSLRVLEGESGGQGFFLACLQKTGQPTKELPQVNRGLPGEPLDKSYLAKTCAPCWNNLPPGQIRVFKQRLFFLPAQAYSLLPQALNWQGFYLGRLGKNKISPDPRARILLPERADAQSIVLDSVEEIKRLNTGQSLQLEQTAQNKGLYWKDLPLGWLTIKGKRALWSAVS